MLGPGAHRLKRRRQRRQGGHARQSLLRVQVQAQQRVQGRQIQLVDAQRTRQRVAAHGVHDPDPAHGDAGLGAAQQLVAAERHDVGAGGDAVRQRRLLREQRQRRQGAAAQVIDEHGVVLVRQGRQLLRRGSEVKPTMR